VDLLPNVSNALLLMGFPLYLQYGDSLPPPLTLPVLSLVLLPICLLPYIANARCKELAVRFFVRLERSKDLLCPDCHASLTDYVTQGRCPQCGAAFSPASLRDDWSDVRRLSDRALHGLVKRNIVEERWENIDTWLRCVRRAAYFLAFLYAIVLIIVANLVAKGSLRMGSFYAVMLAPLVLLGCLFGWSWHRRERFFQRLESEEYLICPDCHYLLKGHTGGGRCPECMYEFTPESLRADWAAVEKLARWWH
jgi:uncharacterized paraquat-inducible protein A